jgi:hypothetical protein
MFAQDSTLWLVSDEQTTRRRQRRPYTADELSLAAACGFDVRVARKAIQLGADALWRHEHRARAREAARRLRIRLGVSS